MTYFPYLFVCVIVSGVRVDEGKSRETLKTNSFELASSRKQNNSYSTPGWTLLSSTGSYGQIQLDATEVNRRFQTEMRPIVKRECTDCSDTHREVYFVRKTDPSKWDAYQGLLVTWRGDQGFHQDFDIYSSLEDACNDMHPWKFCNGNDPGIGFPRDCGPDSLVAVQWTSLAANFARWTRNHVRYTVANWEEACRWSPIMVTGTLGNLYLTKEELNRRFQSETRPIVQYQCTDCSADTHREMYFVRKTDPSKWDAYQGLFVTWRGDQGFHHDFDIYKTLEDACNDKNPFLFCNGNDPGIGFPRDCGPEENVPVVSQWVSLEPWRGGRKNVKFTLSNWEKACERPAWSLLMLTGSFGSTMLSKSEWTTRWGMQMRPIVQRECTDCSDTHRDVYFVRKTNPSLWDVYDGLLVTWRGDQGFHNDFDIYSSLEDACNDVNPWKFCNGNDPGIGFPRDCGPDSLVPVQWTSLAQQFAESTRKHVKFTVSDLAKICPRGNCKDFVCPSSTTPLIGDSTKLCKAARCISHECCRVSHIAMARET